MKELTLNEQHSLLIQESISIKAKLREIVVLIDRETGVNQDLLDTVREQFLNLETDRVHDNGAEDLVGDEVDETAIDDILTAGTDWYADDEEHQETISIIRAEMFAIKLARG